MPASILVIQVSRIGDTLLTTPALAAIAAANPGAKLTVLGHAKRHKVLEHLPGITTHGTISKHSAPWRGRLPFKAYDLAFVYGLDAPLVRYALRVARRVVAFRQGNPALEAHLAAALPWPAPEHVHWVDRLLALPRALDMPATTRRIQYQVTPQEGAEASARLYAAGLHEAQPCIGLQVASFPTKAHRDWPIEHFIALTDALRARWPGAGFLLYGGPDDRPRTAQLKEKLGARALDLAGRLSLRQSAAMMSQTGLYIGVDTGPTHLMSAFDIPMVALYHSLYPSAIYGPLDHPCAELIDHPGSGRPGASERDAMADIPVEAVLARIERLTLRH